MPMQIYPIPSTHACVMVAIKPITTGEEVTVRYEKGGYYGQKCRCKGCSGTDPTDLSVLKPNGRNDWGETCPDRKAVGGTSAN